MVAGIKEDALKQKQTAQALVQDRDAEIQSLRLQVKLQASKGYAHFEHQ
jgi:hypothetical protein